MKLSCATIQMKAIEYYFHVVLFIMLYKVVLILKSVLWILSRWNESYWAVLSCGTVQSNIVQSGLKSVHEALVYNRSKAIEQNFPLILFVS